MGQQANNGGRRASLDDKKLRAAGRGQNTPEQEAILDAVGMTHGKDHPVAGAFGKDGHPNHAGNGTAAARKKRTRRRT